MFELSFTDFASIHNQDKMENFSLDSIKHPLHFFSTPGFAPKQTETNLVTQMRGYSGDSAVPLSNLHTIIIIIIITNKNFHQLKGI